MKVSTISVLERIPMADAESRRVHRAHHMAPGIGKRGLKAEVLLHLHHFQVLQLPGPQVKRIQHRALIDWQFRLSGLVQGSWSNFRSRTFLAEPAVIVPLTPVILTFYTTTVISVTYALAEGEGVEYMQVCLL